MLESIFKIILVVLVGGVLLGLILFDVYRYCQNHWGRKKEVKGVLLKKEITTHHAISSRFFLPPYRDQQKARFSSTFQIGGETLTFYSDYNVYDKLVERKKYRLLCQGERLLSARKG